MVGALMTLGKLESLQIGTVPFRLRENALQLAPISRLSITALIYTADIFAIMRHLRGTLVHCDVKITLWKKRRRNNPKPESQLALDLSLLTRLRHLSISHERNNPQSSPATPFMDEVIKHLPELETIYCCHGTFTGRLFSRLPGTVHTLQLETMDPLVQEIKDVCARKRAGISCLRLLELGYHQTWGRGYYDQRRPAPSPELINHCEAVGIVIDFLESRYHAKRAFYGVQPKNVYKPLHPVL